MARDMVCLMSARISIVYQVYLNEDEDDVTRKNLKDVEIVISLIGRSCGL